MFGLSGGGEVKSHAACVVCSWPIAAGLWGCLRRRGRVRGKFQVPDQPQTTTGTLSCPGGENSLDGAFSWTLLTWGEEAVVEAPEVQRKNRQLTFGSRWGSVHRCGADASGAERVILGPCSLPIRPHPQPSHLRHHSLRVITHGTRRAHDGCWETRAGTWHDCFFRVQQIKQELLNPNQKEVFFVCKQEVRHWRFF